MGHFHNVCPGCGKTNQCRCPGDKKITYVECNECASKTCQPGQRLVTVNLPEYQVEYLESVAIENRLNISTLISSLVAEHINQGPGDANGI